MDRIEVLGDVRAVLIREGGGVGRGVSIVGKIGDSTLGSSMAPNVCDDWVSVIVLLSKAHVADLDESFDLVMDM